MTRYTLFPEHTQRPHEKIISWFGYALLGVLVVLGLGFMLLNHMGYKFLSVQTGSMVPNIQKGDLIITQPVPFKALKTGDVITYKDAKHTNRTITHRIVAIDNHKQTVRTKGDANRHTDAPVAVKNIVGTNIATLPKFGVPMQFTRSIAGVVLLVYIPALLVVMHEFRRLSEYYKMQGTYRVYGDKTQHVLHPNGLAAFGAIALLIVSPLAGGRAQALTSSARMSGNTIQAVFLPSSYQVCNFPSHEALLSYGLIDVFYPEQPDPPLQLAQPILPGTYRVTALSNDDHIANPNEPSQPNERWLAELYGANQSQQLYTTGVTDDIPDSIDQTSTVVNAELRIDQQITAIRYVHNAWLTGLEQDSFGGRSFDQLTYAEKRSVLWNSVKPGCITFTRVR